MTGQVEQGLRHSLHLDLAMWRLVSKLFYQMNGGKSLNWIGFHGEWEREIVQCQLCFWQVVVFGPQIKWTLMSWHILLQMRTQAHIYQIFIAIHNLPKTVTLQKQAAMSPLLEKLFFLPRALCRVICAPRMLPMCIHTTTLCCNHLFMSLSPPVSLPFLHLTQSLVKVGIR